MSTQAHQTFFLALSLFGGKRLSARIGKSMPRLKANEVALSLQVTLPVALFNKPSLQASIVVPPESVSTPVIDATVVENIRAVISQQLGVNLTIAVIQPELEIA